MNEIKTTLANVLMDHSNKTKVTEHRKDTASFASPDVSLNPHLTDLAAIVLGDNVVEDNEKVQRIKNQVQQGSYQIDHDTLAEKLIHQVLKRV